MTNFCRRLRFVAVGLVAGLILSALEGNVDAQYRNIYNNEVVGTDADGNDVYETVFRLNFVGTGWEGSVGADNMAAVAEAAQYWVDILKSTGTMPEVLDIDGNVVLDANGDPVRQPVVFTVSFGGSPGNASAGTNGYVKSEVDGFNMTLAEALMVDEVYVGTVSGGHARITIGAGWTPASGSQTQSGRNDSDLATVIIHELGHALGIADSATYEVFDHLKGEYVENWEYQAGVYDDPFGLGVYSVRWYFPETLSRYDSRLRDNNGNSPITLGTTGGKTIGYDSTGKNTNTIFDMGDPATLYSLGNPSHPTFVGKNTLELWYGKSYDSLTAKQQNNGVPIQGYTFGYDWSYPYSFPYYLENLRWVYNGGGTLSHIDTTNSLMSWQSYRNYPGFIEIEFAVMQDIGYTIERRNFFGKSFYADGDGETPFYNSTHFAHWNATDQAYDLSKPNTSTYALGTHLFANNLNIIQTGTTWVAGAGAAGVRIDGQNNRFTLARNASIVAAGTQTFKYDTDGYPKSYLSDSGSPTYVDGSTEDTENNPIKDQDDNHAYDYTSAIGLLVAYGRDHKVTLQQGSQIKVGGGPGHAVSFNFGEPTVGDKRGSYYTNSSTGLPFEELNGPLVNDFNVSGTIYKAESTPFDCAPIITAGLADRLVTRGNDAESGYRFVDYYKNDGVYGARTNLRTANIVRIFENGELFLPTYNLNEGGSFENLIDADAARLLVNPEDGCVTILYHDQVISVPKRDEDGNLVYDEETGDPVLPVVNTWRDVCDSVIKWYDQQRGGNFLVTSSEIDAEESRFITVLHDSGDGVISSATIGIDIWYDEQDEIYKYGRIYTNEAGVVIYDDENVNAPLFDAAGLNYAPTDDTDFKIIFYDAEGNLVDKKFVSKALAEISDNVLFELDNYELYYGAGGVTAESLTEGYEIEPRLFILYPEDEYEITRPWSQFITADQDTVHIPVTGAAIFIDESAHVERINIMQGASIEGNIISQYVRLTAAEMKEIADDRGVAVEDVKNDLDKHENRLRTTISFGLKADADGNATEATDPDFKFVFKHNINYHEHFERAYVNDRPGYFHKVTNTLDGKGGDYDFVDGEFVYVGPGLGEYIKDLFRWGTWDYDEINGIFVEVGTGIDGTGLGRFQGIAGDNFNLEDAGKIDLHFAAGYTEFYSNRSIVDSVTIDAGATFTLSAFRDGENILAPRVIVKEDFYNNGRFSGEGGVWVGARNVLTKWKTVDEYNELFPTNIITIGTVMGYVGDGTFRNDGTIAPGSDNGAGVGILTFQGNVIFTKNAVYELTIGGEQKDRYHSAVLPDGNFVDQSGKLYYTMDIYNDELTMPEDPEKWEVWELFRDNETKITGTGNDVIVVSDHITLDGTLKINVLPDSIYGNETTTHTIIQAGLISGAFAKVEYDQAFLAITDMYLNPFNIHEAQVTVIRDLDFFKRQGKTKNEITMGTAVDDSLFHSPEIAFSLGDSRNSADDIRDVLRQMSASARANSAMINFWSPSEVLFNRIGWGNGQMPTGDRGRVDWDRMTRRKDRILGQTPMRTRVGSLWGDYINTTFNADSDGNAEKYNIRRNGFMLGGEWNLTPYSAVGAIMAYADSKLKQHGDSVESDDYMLGLYFVSAPMNEYEFKAYLGTGFQEYDFNRHVRNANIYTDSISDARGIYDRYVGDTQGNTLNVSLELARPLMLHPTYILRPTLGLDTQFLWQDGFTEKDHNTAANDNAFGSYLYALKYKRMRLDRSLLRVGFSSETTGSRGSLRMKAFYVTRIGGDACATSDARFIGGSDLFSIDGVRVARNFLNLGVGTNLWLDGERTASFFLDYDANIYNSSRKVHAHTFSIGVLQNF